MASRSRPPPRVYLPDAVPPHGIAPLPPEQAHHVVNVLRLAQGDAVTVFDGGGLEYDATIDRIAKSGVALRMGTPHEVDRESPLRITLAQGISSGERMDYTIQKAVELGAHAIQPLATERSIVRLDAARAEKRVAHWQGVVVAACEQCGRNTVPLVLPVAPFNTWLGAPTGNTIRFTLTPGAARKLADIERPDAGIVLLAGPEGGLSPREHETAIATGFIPLRLGPRVLRTETAALAALAAMQALWGDF